MTKKVPYHEVVLDTEYKFVSLLYLTMTTCPFQRLQWGKYRHTVKTLAFLYFCCLYCGNRQERGLVFRNSNHKMTNDYSYADFARYQETKRVTTR